MWPENQQPILFFPSDGTGAGAVGLHRPHPGATRGPAGGPLSPPEGIPESRARNEPEHCWVRPQAEIGEEGDQ